MPQQWVILEGGVTNTFPLSINQSVDWTKMVRGECSLQSNTDFAKDGVLAYTPPPAASGSFFAKEFVPESTADTDVHTDTQTKRFWAYGRWWRINLATPHRLEYTDFGQQDAATFTAIGYDDFNEDSNDPIAMIATSGDGKWFILKATCAYTLTNANGDSTNFKKSAAYYGMGCCNPAAWVSNAVVAGNVVAVWDGGGEFGPRHYLWDGVNGATELSRNVRALSEMQSKDQRAGVNWPQNLILCGRLVYDLDNKRVFYYNETENFATAVTRPYFEAQFRPIVVSKLAVICTGKTGSFTVTVEYGQAEDSLEESKVYLVAITNTSKNRFRHVIMLETPIRCRVWRLAIDQLTGTGITQIQALTEIADNPDAYDGEV